MIRPFSRDSSIIEVFADCAPDAACRFDVTTEEAIDSIARDLLSRGACWADAHRWAVLEALDG